MVKSISTITAVLLGGVFGQVVSLGENTHVKVEEQQDYQQDSDRVRSLNSALSARKPIELNYIQDIADDFRKKWSVKNREYYARLILGICNPLSSGSLNDDRQYGTARNLALSALENPDMIPLNLELMLINHVTSIKGLSDTSVTNNFLQLRKQDITVHLHAWRRVLNGVDSEWDSDEVIIDPNSVIPANVNWVSGESPHAIKDPQLRAVYQAALQQRRQQLEKRDEQIRLRQWLENDLKNVEKHIIQAYSRPPFNLEELRQVLDVYLNDKGIKTRILDAVGRNIEMHAEKAKNKEDK